MDLAQLEQEVKRLRREVAGLIARGSLAGGVLALHVGGEAGDVDRCLPYGFSSTPADGTECAAHLSGDHAFVLGDLDAARPSTSKGEWTLYDRHGNKITSDANGLTVTAAAGKAITLDAGEIKLGAMATLGAAYGAFSPTTGHQISTIVKVG